MAPNNSFYSQGTMILFHRDSPNFPLRWCNKKELMFNINYLFSESFQPLLKSFIIEELKNESSSMIDIQADTE